MDTVTHVLFAGLIARLPRQQRHRENELSPLARISAVALGAAFPDIDYILFWWDPYQFITHWHRGVTHSLLMIPVWSIVLGVVFAITTRQFRRWGAFSCWCALGLICHIATDVLTIYGTQIFAPLSDYRLALNLTFDIDPWFGLLTGISLVGSYYNKAVARWGVFVLLVYLITQAFFQRYVLSLAEQAERNQQGSGSKIYAIPQPVSPFHWKLVVEHDDYYDIAYFKLFNSSGGQIFARDKNRFWLLSGYHSEKNLAWYRVHRFGEADSDRKIAIQVWQHDEFSRFRHFARLPALYRIDRDRAGMCVWFTDLRHILPGITPPFRYGMCRISAQNKWQMYRLKRSTKNSRQLISGSLKKPLWKS